MKNIFAMMFLLGAIPAQAQYTVTFQFKNLPTYHTANSSVFVAGSFNNWKPDSTDFGTTNGSLTIRLPKGMYEYKFTRGSWQASETGTSGAAVSNRVLNVESDTTIVVDIKDWADHFPKQEKQSTATKNVHILDTAFFMPQLARHRRITIYLPESYSSTRKKYPVLYMQDGQNVFDEKTAYAGEWGIDKTLNALGSQMGESIVVAVDNGGEKRMSEYSPYDFTTSGTYASKKISGEGDLYADFLVKTLKPFIQKKYRVKKCRKYQAIAGSSMGGLISFYTMLKYPKAFGAAGVFSPAFWIAPQLKNSISVKAKNVKGRIYFYAGKQEGSRMVPDMLAVFEQMSKHSKAEMTTVIRTDGTHSEAQWRQEFPLFYKWWTH